MEDNSVWCVKCKKTMKVWHKLYFSYFENINVRFLLKLIYSILVGCSVFVLKNVKHKEQHRFELFKMHMVLINYTLTKLMYTHYSQTKQKTLLKEKKTLT